LVDEQISVEMRKCVHSVSTCRAYVLSFVGELSRDPAPPFPAIIIEGATVNMSNSLQWAYALTESELDGLAIVGEGENFFLDHDDDGRSEELEEPVNTEEETASNDVPKKWWQFWRPNY
jgi:hypothetical protein